MPWWLWVIIGILTFPVLVRVVGIIVLAWLMVMVRILDFLDGEERQ